MVLNTIQTNCGKQIPIGWFDFNLAKSTVKELISSTLWNNYDETMYEFTQLETPQSYIATLCWIFESDLSESQKVSFLKYIPFMQVPNLKSELYKYFLNNMDLPYSKLIIDFLES